jgi:hypothetical protein
METLMNLRPTRSILAALAALVIFAAAGSAEAGLFRTYLSVTGSDANPCTVALPCRLLPAALAAVNDGGEIWIVNSANYNTATVNITKSVTVLAIPGALGSIVANGGDAVAIGTASVQVTLRNLVLLNLSAGTNGINFSQGAGLTVEDCEIYGMPNFGLSLTAASSKVNIKRTVIRDSGSNGVDIQGTVTATLDGVHLLNNGGHGLNVSGNSKTTLSNGVVANNGATGVVAQSASGSATVQLVVERSLIRANFRGIAASSNGAGDIIQVSLSQNSIVSNPTGIGVIAGLGGSTKATLDSNVIGFSLTSGVDFSGVGTLIVNTRSNNTFKFNTTDLSGGVLTPLAGV